MSADAPIVIVGRIGGAYGVKGWVRINAFTVPRQNIADYRPWMLARSESDEWRPARIEALRDHRDGFVGRFADCEDRAKAEALSGSLIGVPEAALPAPESDEFYWRALEGMEVVNKDHRCLGRVTGLMETGAHDVLVIGGGHGGELLVPFHRSYVLSVDEAERRILVDWPDED